MEQKNLMTRVFTNEVIFNEAAEQPIDVDFTLPDYCPEINKILKCRAVPHVASKGMNGRSITVDGSVTVTVLYADGENRLCAYEYLYPFNKNFEAGGDCDGADLTCTARCEYINCRAVTGRKMDIHGAVGIYVKVLKRKSDDIIADVDDPNIELRRGSIPATTPMGTAEKYLMIEEEIDLGQGQPPVRALLRYDAIANVRESKLLNEKAIVKGDLVVSLLYAPDSGTVQTMNTVFPFSQLLEMQGVTDQCGCDARVCVASLELKPRTSANGEIRGFSLNAKLRVSSTAYCDHSIDVITDAYSRKFEAGIVKKEVRFQKICRNLNETYLCKSSLQFPEGAVGTVADLWCEAQAGNIKTDPAGITVEGMLTANFIVYDTDGVPAYYERPVEFQYRYPFGEDLPAVSCEPQLSVISANYTLTGSGTVELRAEIGISAALYCTAEPTLIVGLEIDDSQPIARKDRGAMTIYFAGSGEPIWDIARRYAASVDEIKQINGVTSDVLSEDQMILVPMN